VCALASGVVQVIAAPRLAAGWCAGVRCLDGTISEPSTFTVPLRGLKGAAWPCCALGVGGNPRLL